MDVFLLSAVSVSPPMATVCRSRRVKRVLMFLTEMMGHSFPATILEPILRRRDGLMYTSIKESLLMTGVTSSSMPVERYPSLMYSVLMSVSNSAVILSPGLSCVPLWSSVRMMGSRSPTLKNAPSSPLATMSFGLEMTLTPSVLFRALRTMLKLSSSRMALWFSVMVLVKPSTALRVRLWPTSIVSVMFTVGRISVTMNVSAVSSDSVTLIPSTTSYCWLFTL